MRSFRLILIATLLIVASVALAQNEDYEIPADPEGMDPDTVVASIDDATITLGELRERIRYERFYYYYVLNTLVEQQGEQVLDLTDPNNQWAQFIGTLVDNLAVDELFAEPILNVMVREQLYRNEAETRGVELDQCAVDEYWALLLNEQNNFVECTLPPGFDEKRDAFLAQAVQLAGRTEDEVQQTIEARAQFDAVVEEVQAELVVPDVDTVMTRHIRVADEDTANEVLERLQAGEDFQDVLIEYTIDEGAAGNGGALGELRRGQAISTFGTPLPELEDALFAAEVGDVLGPIETTVGFHIAEVLDQTQSIRARHILLDSLDDANTAINLLNNGADFAELAATYSLDPGSGASGGDLGFFGRGMMVAPFEEAAFNADVGEIVGPVETQFGFHIIEKTEIGTEPDSVTARHIVVETEEEAQDVLQRLEAGEDFADLAYEVSLDLAAKGHQGDTGLIASFTGGQGFYARTDIAQDFANNVFDAEAGDILGPIESIRGDFLIIEVQEKGTRPPSQDLITVEQQSYAREWQEEQIASDRVEVFDEVWRDYVPTDPIASDVDARLAPLEPIIEQAAVTYAEFVESTNILNTLRNLEAPEVAEPESE